MPSFIYWPERVGYAVWERATEGIFNPEVYRHGWSATLAWVGIVLTLASHRGFSHLFSGRSLFVLVLVAVGAMMPREGDADE